MWLILVSKLPVCYFPPPSAVMLYYIPLMKMVEGHEGQLSGTARNY